jgi:hypothetical protein
MGARIGQISLNFPPFLLEILAIGSFLCSCHSFPTHFTGSFGELNTQKSPFSQTFHHFHTDNNHILSEKTLIGKKTMRQAKPQ